MDTSSERSSSGSSSPFELHSSKQKPFSIDYILSASRNQDSPLVDLMEQQPPAPTQHRPQSLVSSSNKLIETPGQPAGHMPMFSENNQTQVNKAIMQQQHQQTNPNFLYFMACMLLQQQQQQQQQQAHALASQQLSNEQQTNQTNPIDSLAILARLTGNSVQTPLAAAMTVGGRTSVGQSNCQIGHQSGVNKQQQQQIHHQQQISNRLNTANSLHRPQPYPQTPSDVRALISQHHHQQFGAAATTAVTHAPLIPSLGPQNATATNITDHIRDGQRSLASLMQPPQLDLFTSNTNNNNKSRSTNHQLPIGSNKQFVSRAPLNASSAVLAAPDNQQSAAANHSGRHHSGEKLDNLKPAHSYIGLIGMCILSSPEKRMVLNDIYQFILDHYPYYRNRGSGWRNSVRHNLSLNECFQKAGRAANGKGHYWTIHPANMEDFMNGDFRRRRAQRKVRRWNNMDVPSDESDDESTEDATKPPLPEHFKRSIEMHKRLESMSFRQHSAVVAAKATDFMAAALAVANQHQQQQQASINLNLNSSIQTGTSSSHHSPGGCLPSVYIRPQSGQSL